MPAKLCTRCKFRKRMEGSEFCKFCLCRVVEHRVKNHYHALAIAGRPTCADDFAATLLDSLINAKPIPGQNTGSFGAVTEKELSLYARIKRIKYGKAKSSELKLKIQAFQERYPGTIEAFARSGRKLRQVQNGSN